MHLLLEDGEILADRCPIRWRKALKDSMSQCRRRAPRRNLGDFPRMTRLDIDALLADENRKPGRNQIKAFPVLPKKALF